MRIIMKNNYKNECCICGKKLIYKSQSEKLTCFYCGEHFFGDVTCVDGHYVCDICHASSANDLIETLCISTSLENPLDLANSIMNHPEVKMHGPEHHFLVPAVLLASYYNKTKEFQTKESTIRAARKRAEKVLGGFCGSHGNCGAAVGVGIFVSLVNGNNPLANKEWKEANMATAKSLSIIAEHGGPRCCKRNSFLAIESAIKHFSNILQNDENIVCDFYKFNKECKEKECPYFK
jgi:hypothetical protein